MKGYMDSSRKGGVSGVRSQLDQCEQRLKGEVCPGPVIKPSYFFASSPCPAYALCGRFAGETSPFPMKGNALLLPTLSTLERPSFSNPATALSSPLPFPL